MLTVLACLIIFICGFLIGGTIGMQWGYEEAVRESKIKKDKTNV